MKSIFWIIGALFVILPFGKSLAQEQNWELRQNDDGIKMYTRSVAGYKLKELKAELKINASVDKIKDIIIDFDNLTKWADKVDSSYILSRPNKNTVINYSIYKTPWPAKDRDLILETTWEKLNNNSVIIRFEGLPDYLNQRPSLIRIPYMVGYWQIEEISANKSKLTYVFHSDTGGSIPKWMINQVLIKSPKKSIENIRRIAEN